MHRRPCAGLRREAQSAANELDGAVANSRAAMRFPESAAANLRLHANLSALCRLLQPRIVITTIEGVATERLIWHAAGVMTRGRCAWAISTPDPERAHAIRRSLRAPGIDCDPRRDPHAGRDSPRGAGCKPGPRRHSTDSLRVASARAAGGAPCLLASDRADASFCLTETSASAATCLNLRWPARADARI